MAHKRLGHGEFMDISIRGDEVVVEKKKGIYKLPTFLYHVKNGLNELFVFGSNPLIVRGTTIINRRKPTRMIVVPQGDIIYDYNRRKVAILQILLVDTYLSPDISLFDKKLIIHRLVTQDEEARIRGLKNVSDIQLHLDFTFITIKRDVLIAHNEILKIINP